MAVLDLGNGVRIGIFLTAGVLISGLSEALRSARFQAEKVARFLAEEKTTSDLERKRLQAVLDILPIGVIIADMDGRFSKINAAVHQIWGESALIANGIEQYQGYRGWWAGTGQPIGAREWALARAIAKGETSINEEIDIENFDGERKTILDSAIPLRDEIGAISGAVGVNVDITERKQAQEALRRTDARLTDLHDIDRAILEAQSSHQLVRSALAQLLQLVPCQQVFVLLFNFETQEAAVLASTQSKHSTPNHPDVFPLNDVIPEPILAGSLDDWVNYILTQKSCPAGLLSPGDSLDALDCLHLPLQVEQSLLGELVVLDPAITFSPEHREIINEVADSLAIALQQAQLREQLQNYTAELEQRVTERTSELQLANDALEAFAYSVSHDLRAPLRAIEGMGQALLEDYASQLPAEGQMFGRRIVGAAQQMEVLIQNLLDYSRLSRAELRLQPLNLNLVVTDVITQMQEELNAAQANVTVEGPLPVVIGQYILLVQAIANLISNAIKFVAPGVQPRIRIWAESTPIEPAGSEADPRVRLWIEDNGIGIEPRFQERVFQVFERLHGAETYPGTGIGLAIVQKGIERMGGRVGLDSTTGEGSRFWLELSSRKTE